jgi:uncharacterized alpha-E superfamily protein
MRWPNRPWTANKQKTVLFTHHHQELTIHKQMIADIMAADKESPRSLLASTARTVPCT